MFECGRREAEGCSLMAYCQAGIMVQGTQAGKVAGVNGGERTTHRVKGLCHVPGSGDVA